MKKLIISLVVVAAMLLALIVAPSLIGDKGYVLIALGNFTVETTVVALGIMVFFGLLLWIVATSLGARLLRLTKGSGDWFGNRSKRKQEKAFYRSIQALAEGDWPDALKSAQKAQHDRFEGVNFLIAAQAASAQQNLPDAKQYLTEAKAYPSSALAATLTLARLELGNQRPDTALSLLNELTAKQQAAAPAVLLQVEALAAAKQWQILEDKLPAWKKVLGNDYVIWSKRVATGRFAEVASKQGALQLKSYWQSLPRKMRHDEGYQAAYIEQLLAQGMHSDAQSHLLEWQKRGPSAVLLPLFHQLQMPNPAPSIKALEKWIKADPTNADLYRALGYLAHHSNDNALAQRALQKAITLKPNQQDLLLLADISESQDDARQALALYKQGTSLS